jgi:hypothetical protein
VPQGIEGAERIAAAWARAPRAAVLFRPNRKAHPKAAPFRASDDMLRAHLRGVILFGGGGIGLNLAEKAQKKGLHVARVAAEGVERRQTARPGGDASPLPCRRSG